MTLKSLKWFSLIACLLFLPMAVFGQYDIKHDVHNKEDIEMIQSMNDKRKIRSSKTLNIGNIERIYYVAADGATDVFCIQSKYNNGVWKRDIETSALLPASSTETPFIDFVDNQRVYITYYPDDKLSQSVFSYAYTLVYEESTWYVESVSFGKLDEGIHLFKATVVNLAQGLTSTYSFDTKSEEIVASEEAPNNQKKIRVADFVLSDFISKIALEL